MVTTVCVVSGSRAEYGMLRWIIHDLRNSSEFRLQLIVTGMHLVAEFGSTIDEIKRDGVIADKCVHMLLASDVPVGISKSVGVGVIGMADALAALDPDIVLLLGDRFEIFAAAQVCMLQKIPIAHIAGGDVTEGAIDESIRHAITKMAHVHFATNQKSADRIRQMGEDPARVFVVGSPGLDQLYRESLPDRVALEAELGESLGETNILATFHPVTLAADGGLFEFGELLAALDRFGPKTRIWFTYPNADASGAALASVLGSWAEKKRDQVRIYRSLGHRRYLGLMKHADVVAGNSSSALYEAPSLGVAAVDVGDRQRGRLAGQSVVHADGNRESIYAALVRAMAMDCRSVDNPYGDGEASGRILGVLRRLPARDLLIRKRFVPIETSRD